MQIRREGAEAAHWLGCAVCPHSRHMHPRSDINCSCVRVHHRQCTSRLVVARFFPSHRQPSCCGAEGLGCAVVQFPTRDRRMASPLSSPQQPMDHVFLRGHSPPKSTRPLPSVRRIELRRFYAHRADAVRDLFLKVMSWRAKNLDSALRLPGIRRLCRAETISFNVRSRCPRMRARICWEYFSNGEVLPPRGIASEVPSSRKRCTQRMAELALTWNCSAASRRDPPASTKSITRILNSPGYGPRIGQPSGESMR